MIKAQDDYSNVCDGVLEYKGNSNPPSRVNIGGIEYERFLDRFFINRPTCNLTKGQITEICRLREKDLAWQHSNSANSQVRSLFKEIILKAGPNSIFEIGPGSFPLFPPGLDDFTYRQGDLDERVVIKNREEGYDIFHFDFDSKLPIHNESVDLAIGIFFLQFNISENQIHEITRILKQHGGLLANIYRQTSDILQILYDNLEGHGLNITIYPDPKELCRQHQYWLLSKSTNTDLHFVCEELILSS